MKKWKCSNCGAEWNKPGSGSPSCPYSHGPTSSSLRVEFQPVPKPVKVKKLSKIQKWNIVRKELKIRFEKAGITSCELRLPGCLKDNFLGFAHTTKRRDVKDLKKVVLACQNCHEKIEYAPVRWTQQPMQEYLEGIIRGRKFERYETLKKELNS